MFEHPEYKNISQELKDSPLFNFEIYLKNKGKTLEEIHEEFEQNMKQLRSWLDNVSNDVIS